MGIFWVGRSRSLFTWTRETYQCYWRKQHLPCTISLEINPPASMINFWWVQTWARLVQIIIKHCFPIYKCSAMSRRHIFVKHFSLNLILFPSSKIQDRVHHQHLFLTSYEFLNYVLPWTVRSFSYKWYEKHWFQILNGTGASSEWKDCSFTQVVNYRWATPLPLEALLIQISKYFIMYARAS